MTTPVSPDGACPLALTPRIAITPSATAPISPRPHPILLIRRPPSGAPFGSRGVPNERRAKSAGYRDDEGFGLRFLNRQMSSARGLPIRLRLRLLKPERHVHLAIHRGCGGEVLLRLFRLARASVEPD